MWGIPRIDLGARASEDISQKAPKESEASYRDWDIGQEAKEKQDKVNTADSASKSMVIGQVGQGREDGLVFTRK